MGQYLNASQPSFLLWEIGESNEESFPIICKTVKEYDFSNVWVRGIMLSESVSADTQEDSFDIGDITFQDNTTISNFTVHRGIFYPFNIKTFNCTTTSPVFIFAVRGTP